EALEVQRVIADDRLLPNVQAGGEQLRGRWRKHYAQHPHIGDVRGRGLFVGVELVRERATKAPFDASLKLHAAIRRLHDSRDILEVIESARAVDGSMPAHQHAASGLPEPALPRHLTGYAVLGAVQ
ncbi:hypothetical protein QMO17_38285, partial [Klebsiella pneumoniae]|nr:hypothetical protein [Klebsiella pneumoniae]